jgi:hypothetical protein
VLKSDSSQQSADRIGYYRIGYIFEWAAYDSQILSLLDASNHIFEISSMKGNIGSSVSGSATKPKEGEYNIFRDSALRYMGYANEVGESFRYQASFSTSRQII